MNYWDIARFCTRYFRRRRLRRFQEMFAPAQHPRILDIGGTSAIWELIDYPGEITLLNIDSAALPSGTSGGKRSYTTVVGNGCSLKYQDSSFDLAFANSVIEHVGDESAALAFANEMRRVGRAVFCQTPNKWFWFEPHLGVCFLHWFPGLLRNYYVVRYCTLWGLMHKPTRQQARDAVESIRLLTRSEMTRLFPDAEIHTEKFLSVFPKSFTAIRKVTVNEMRSSSQAA